MSIASSTCAISTHQEDLLSSENNQLKQIIKLLGKELQTARGQIERIQQEKKDLSEQSQKKETSLLQECQKLKLQIQTLTDEYNILLQREKTPVQPPSDTGIARLAMELSRTQEELHSLTCERAVITRAHKEAEQETKQLREEIKKAQATLILSQQQEAKAVQEKGEITIQFQELQKEVESMKEKLHTHVQQELLSKEQIANTLQEYADSEKRLKETEELLVIKLAQLDECEEQKELFQQKSLSLEEENKQKEEALFLLEIDLREEKTKSSSAAERIDSLSKERDVLQQKQSAVTQRLLQLEGWKRQAAQSFTQIRTAVDTFSDYEKQSDQQPNRTPTNSLFSEEHSLFHTRAPDHGSLF